MFLQDDDEYDREAVDGYFPQPAERTNLLLSFNGLAVGIATLDDLGNGKAAMRSVAVRKEFQGKGHGRELLKAVEAFAKSCGVSELCVNTDPQKTRYYMACGFSENVWSQQEMDFMKSGRASPMPVQMHKLIEQKF